jgi:mono/diheme cytochrome c family protein
LRAVAEAATSVLLLAILLAGCSPHDDATDRGRRIYRDGVLPSGDAMTALVAGDVPILGTQVTCQSCHGRSGMGAAEGPYIVPPITGPILFAESPQPKRPAYEVESLARLLREGVTPGGRHLRELMPRYRLEDHDVVALAAYLATLSAGNSPGLDDKVIHFATVITPDVDAGEREAVLAVLNQYFEEKNRQTRLESERWDRGDTPESQLPTVFRKWLLEEWMLTGPSESWNEQLERYYARTPVFAMVSGLGAGTWAPIGRFCERREIPCLLPVTDLPDADDGQFYTLYYSRGLALEADLIANHLAAGSVQRVIQVYCDAAGAQAAQALRRSLGRIGAGEEVLEFDCATLLPVADLAARMAEGQDTAAVLWVRHEQLAGLDGTSPSGRVYVSSTLLDSAPTGVLSSAPGAVFMAHPFRLPGSPDPAMLRFGVWVKTRGIDLVEPRKQAEAFFACLALNDALKHMGRFFIRDYLLDMLDHAQALAAYLPVHPRPTFGPGQRFLTKGGYVLQVVSGRPDTDATWILP